MDSLRTEATVIGAVRLKLIDGFELTAAGVPVPLSPGAQRLMAYLALQDHALLRLHVAGVLWPDKSEERSLANLRSTLWRMRRPGLDLVDASETHVRIQREIFVDVSEAIAKASRLLRPSPQPG